MNRHSHKIASLCLFAACLLPLPAAASPTPIYDVTVQATFPHDPRAFTEGLFFLNGSFYESTGMTGHSWIRKEQPETARPLQETRLDTPYFGEGIITWKDRLYQLTWRNHTGFIYDLKTLKPLGRFTYPGEGWSLTRNDHAIIMSDGSANLRILDPQTLNQVSTLAVTADGCPVSNLNELEWVDGQIYANIWLTSLIARIDPKTGTVTSFLDLSHIGPTRTPYSDNVLNGIAWDPEKKRLFVTGKLWPNLYQITVTDKKHGQVSCNSNPDTGTRPNTLPSR
ncbi:glutaminyl-peptide cyclotransferase [Acetobacter oeni]|uniref:Glutamine cyclotransferase n=1 Tax=Acetobacter oeni TaxID=304077 RepID=A0A511XGZ9_9PROT|nr:glutaminyl-peptide cyclotransferase [Acetobacter oeni]MBB3882366.1 glutaminyl-peptide cyclotransferase [Acetobacter oeni]NHO18532.1 glutaminyl-peptide cyclotransferase [Acetobacter oeni]GBR02346.1 glutamine cyclotransferase [Acetobacter oeni LMG 21952]GEN62226.1 glutamine cyclotransferase [Acetobacter oeni]